MNKTEQLREKIRPFTTTCFYREHCKDAFSETNPACEECNEKLDKILLACQKARLAFVVKDAKLPDRNPLGHKGTAKTIEDFYDLGQLHYSQDMLEAGFRQTEEIEL